jgi:hypothetical protein
MTKDLCGGSNNRKGGGRELAKGCKDGAARSMEDELKEATGKTWAEWSEALDEFGAVDRGHTPTVKHLMAHYGLDLNWARAVALRYENQLGLRDLIA